ncbi:hypothetical protein GCK72_015729 [Caenorhabditis remanei]|uniref:BTB domain-containing protein n=1 Tax=Caenorhabditis remanei TaxID=31234 RepID=A0A6A5GXL1_CAERE|nr:hypothetical protein GCK72_015729 [Caenorhabditis remanei]KAF1759265.1 hypothetical protein GCK72_015729 [Caenorhabditis remanei]
MTRRGFDETINGIECWFSCRKTEDSNWQCSLVVHNKQPPSLGWKVEYKIRTNNGVETVGTKEGKIHACSAISFRDDPKYYVNGNMTIECHVELYEVDGNGVRKQRAATEIGSNPPRLFDESVKEFSDVVLVVEEKKFHVIKLVSDSTVLWCLKYYLQFLASESSYFKSLLIGSFEESKKDEISLKDVEAKYFQLFLESLYGDRVINDETVDEIMKLADMFDAKRVRQKCEVYLIKKSRKSLKRKLDLAVQFNSTELKRKCLEDVKTVEDIRSVIPDNLEEMDHSVLASLLDKAIEFSRK